MKIAFGCDHAGYELKSVVLDHLKSRKMDVLDLGTDSSKSVDYPDYASAVGHAVAKGEAQLGVLICGTGLGMAMTANKIAGVRAVTVCEPFSAMMARAHNHANVIALGSRVIGPGLAIMTLDAFLDTPFEGGRHGQRVNKIIALETALEGSRSSGE
jgi:ribose 5-phosphate isomerase B